MNGKHTASFNAALARSRRARSHRSRPSAPMLDVHPPHERVHSWAQFFVHIAAITIGLLIAIGLEQTVEYFHHRHQLQEVRRELRVEEDDNRRQLSKNLEAARTVTAELNANLALLRATQGSPAHAQDQASSASGRFRLGVEMGRCSCSAKYLDIFDALRVKVFVHRSAPK